MQCPFMVMRWNVISLTIKMEDKYFAFFADTLELFAFGWLATMPIFQFNGWASSKRLLFTPNPVENDVYVNKNEFLSWFFSCFCFYFRLIAAIGVALFCFLANHVHWRKDSVEHISYAPKKEKTESAKKIDFIFWSLHVCASISIAITKFYHLVCYDVHLVERSQNISVC